MFGIGGCHHTNTNNHVTTSQIKDLKSRVSVMNEQSKDRMRGPYIRSLADEVKSLKKKLTELQNKVGTSAHNPKKGEMLKAIDTILNKVQGGVDRTNFAVKQAEDKRVRLESQENRAVQDQRKLDRKNDNNNGAYR